MNRRSSVLALLLPLALAACGGKAPPPAPAPTEPGIAPAPAAQPTPAADDPVIAAAIRAALGGDWEAHYFDATVDLNGDGRPEVVAYVAGPMVCGTGGCPVFIFTPAEEGYRLVGSLSVVQPPVRVSTASSNGWRDLVVGIGGGGVAAGNAVLKFDGTSYPTNPTVAPAEPVRSLDGTEVLIAEFASYTDGKALPPATAR